MELSNKTHVTLQGKNYKLKPFSPANEKLLKEQGGDASNKLEAGEITRWQYYDVVLRLVLEGPYDFNVEHPEFDAREAEDAIMSFVPPSLRAYMLLTGFQSF